MKKLSLILVCLLISSGCSKAQGQAWSDTFKAIGGGLAAGAGGMAAGMQANGNSNSVSCIQRGSYTSCSNGVRCIERFNRIVCE